jgi:hypothetical protein
VVDADGGLVVHGPFEVVDIDVVLACAEDLPGVGVGLGERCAGERDEGGVRQGVAQVAGVAVEAVVVAAVRLVDDDQDVAPVGEQRVVRARLLLLLGTAELLQRGEDDAAGPAVGQLLAEFFARLDLDRGLTEERLAVLERREELVVEVVAGLCCVWRSRGT